MSGKGTGGGTSFDGMSHEQMLAWLDQADAGEVQAAADRLTTATTEIRKIADDLKVRPQWVEWKGAGADAFRSWASDLANSTYRLGDLSEGAAKWLGEASGAIARTQASIPRDAKGAQANLDAANAAHNDPDAAPERAKASSDLAALKADREKVRQEAAAQMRGLGQSYEHSATQMNGLERPKFPPLPGAIDGGREHEDLARPGVGASSGADSRGVGSGSSGKAGTVRTGHRDVVTSTVPSDPPTSQTPSGHVRPPTIEPPATHVGIDSTSAPPDVHQPSAAPTGTPPVPARPDTGAPPLTQGPVLPMSPAPVRMPSAPGGPGRASGGERIPTQAGRDGIGLSTPTRGVVEPGPATNRALPRPGVVSGRTVPGEDVVSGRRVPATPGITGGQPAGPSATGRPMGRVPGGVVGGEPTGMRGAVSPVPTSGPRTQPGSRAAGPTAERSAFPAREGIVGGTPQRTGPEPTPPGAPVPSAPTRGGISGGVPSQARTRSSGSAAPDGSTAGARRRQEKKRTDRGSGRPAADDQETRER